MQGKQSPDENATKYPMNLIYSSDDKAYLIAIPALEITCVRGDTPQEALENGIKAVESEIKRRLAKGEKIPTPLTFKDYTGRVVLDVGQNMHRMLEVMAQLEGITLTEFVQIKLSQIKG